MRNNIISIIVFLCFSFALVGCENQNEEKEMKSEAMKTEEMETGAMKTEAEVLAIVNNDIPKEEIITQTYDINSLRTDFFEGKMTVEEVNQKYPIECLRKIKSEYYAIFKDDKGGWCYIMFSDEKGEYVATDFWHYQEPINKADFEKLTLGVTTLEDVQEIDPYGDEMLSLETGRLPFSRHKTADGYNIEITYDWSSGDGTSPKDFTVIQVTINPVSNDSIINKLLEIDKLK